MARRKRVYKKADLRDSRYDSPLVAKLITRLMVEGKRSIAERIVYAAIDKVNEKSETVDPLEVVNRAIENAKPRLEVKSRRVGGATYQVPIEISFERQESLALRWIVDAASSRKGTPMKDALAAEIVDAYNNTGSVVKKKEDTHKMAQANRAFAHLRW